MNMIHENNSTIYYAYILKHDENIGNGMASLEQLEKIYNKIGEGSLKDFKNTPKNI